ncbi:MAG: hypothetical protein IPP30_04255 [Flavobacterium sp.]|nr:hypothetical protein [Flavobacterium sp.]
MMQTKKQINTTFNSSAKVSYLLWKTFCEWSKSQMENFKPQPKLIELNTLFQDTKITSLGRKLQMVFQNPSNIQITTDENYSLNHHQKA